MDRFFRNKAELQKSKLQPYFIHEIHNITGNFESKTLKMMTLINKLSLLAFVAFSQVESAAIGDIARNVHSDLLTLDAGLNPQPVRSRRQSYDVPAGKMHLFYVKKAINKYHRFRTLQGFSVK